MTTATTIIVSWDRNSQPTWLQLHNHRLLRQKQSTHMTTATTNHRLLRQKQSTHMTTATLIIVSRDRNSQAHHRLWLQLQQSSSLETETVNPHDYSHTNHRLSRQKQSTHMTTATTIIVSWDRNSQPTWLQLQLIIVSWDRNSQPTWLQLQQSSSLETETVNPHDCSYNNHRLLRQKQSTHMTTATLIIVSSRQKQSTHMTTATLIIVSWDRNSQPTWLQLQQSSSLETETVNPHDYSYN